MSKIVDYMILNETGGDISPKVNSLIAQGWQPIGGICVVLTEGPRYGGIQSMVPTYNQAMVKYES